MRTCFFLLLLATAGPATGQEAGSRETEHLVLQWADNAVSEEGLAAAEEIGERLYTSIAAMLGYEPKFPVMIVLEGPAERPDGSWGYPRVDGFGRIHLYRFGPTHESYFSALAHELVHVFRIHRRPHQDWFFEEGFAEFVARRVDDNLSGFPWYGYDPVLVAGHWVARGEDIPLTALRERHDELNRPCKLQSYALRYSFFDYLARSFGDESVLEASVQEKAGALADYPRFFDADFSGLESAWNAELMDRYEDIENADELAEQYRTRSPAQYQHVCVGGTDY